MSSVVKCSKFFWVYYCLVFSLRKGSGAGKEASVPGVWFFLMTSLFLLLALPMVLFDMVMNMPCIEELPQLRNLSLRVEPHQVHM